MKVIDYLKNDKLINKSQFAKLMYPDNKNAKVYLSQKLNGLGKTGWLKSDSEKAIRLLKNMSVDISALEE